MKQAYVLINCNAPKNTLIEQIKNIKGVKEVQGTYGAYSIIVKVEEQKGNTPINTIIRKIQQIEHIQSTQIIICLDTGEHKSFLSDIVPDLFMKFPTWF